MPSYHVLSEVRTPWKLAVLAALVGCRVAVPARAHHGRDFLLSQTAELPHPGQLFLIPRQDYVEAEASELELEPALLFGVSKRLALEVHGHVAKESGGDFQYESTAPAFHLLLTPHGSSWGLAFSGEYEFAHGSGEPEHDHEAEEHHGGEAEEHGHGAVDRVEARLAFSARRGGRLFAFNLVASEDQTSGASVEWGYSAGFRGDLRKGLAWGIEAQGDLESDAAHEALLALYYEPSARWTINAGAGTGIGSGDLDLSVRTALVLRIR